MRRRLRRTTTRNNPARQHASLPPKRLIRPMYPHRQRHPCPKHLRHPRTQSSSHLLPPNTRPNRPTLLHRHTRGTSLRQHRPIQQSITINTNQTSKHIQQVFIHTIPPKGQADPKHMRRNTTSRDHTTTSKRSPFTNTSRYQALQLFKPRLL